MSEALQKDKEIGEEEEEEEYVLLELDNCLYSDISPGAQFVLSGLDTLTPTLIVGDNLKMVSHVLVLFFILCTVPLPFGLWTVAGPVLLEVLCA
ncbi:Transcription factor TFIIIC tau55-related protein [Zea mays]|uniref:Transcription factor TFIIIC tau55-related protein n=1 Tax=Zea mays TaxID=4577 RepID=A0A1D6PL01_MAIZE|nr:Transcription factor TFIIIC tau55-related protein [Zea mays]